MLILSVFFLIFLSLSVKAIEVEIYQIKNLNTSNYTIENGLASIIANQSYRLVNTTDIPADALRRINFLPARIDDLFVLKYSNSSNIEFFQPSYFSYYWFFNVQPEIKNGYQYSFILGSSPENRNQSVTVSFSPLKKQVVSRGPWFDFLVAEEELTFGKKWTYRAVIFFSMIACLFGLYLFNRFFAIEFILAPLAGLMIIVLGVFGVVLEQTVGSPFFQLVWLIISTAGVFTIALNSYEKILNLFD